MADHAEESIPKGVAESIRGKIEEKFRDHDSSSSSDSDDGKSEPSSSSAKSRINRLFGREKPVHQVLGGGKTRPLRMRDFSRDRMSIDIQLPRVTEVIAKATNELVFSSETADVLLWRNKKISASFLVVATVIWILFELLGYHLLTLVSYGLIFTLIILFLWSNATSFINKSPPQFPDVSIREDLAVDIALSLRAEINKFFDILRDIVTRRDLKKFLAVIASLWILSSIGGSVNFLTLFFIVIVLLHTVPVLYEKYDDKIDFYWEKVMAELKKQYDVIHAKVISKSRAAQSKFKKQQ